MTGKQTWDAAQGAQSFINYQDKHGTTLFFCAAQSGHASVTKQLIEPRCNIDLKDNVGFTQYYIIPSIILEINVAGRVV
jgi:ankyrin repeat protein